VIFLALPIGTLAFDPLSLPMNYPGLGIEVARFGLSKALASFMNCMKHRRGLSRREMRKIANRRRRYFVDNIIMHHERLHALQRRNKTEKDVEGYLERILNKKSQEELPSRQVSARSLDDWGRNLWRGGESSDSYDSIKRKEIKNNCLELRSKLRARRARQASWMRVLIDSKSRSTLSKSDKNSGWN